MRKKLAIPAIVAATVLVTAMVTMGFNLQDAFAPHFDDGGTLVVSNIGSSGEFIGGAECKVFSRDGELLGEGTTNREGLTRIPIDGVALGHLVIVTCEKDGLSATEVVILDRDGETEVTLVLTAEERPAEPPTVRTACPADKVQHWDKIIFKFGQGLLAVGNAEGDVLFLQPLGFQERIERTLDIKVLDDPDTVAKLEDKVADKLNELGFFAVVANVENMFDVEIETRAVKPGDIEIVEVEYAIACVEPPVFIGPIIPVPPAAPGR